LPVILAVNKIDRVKDKEKIFAFFADAQKKNNKQHGPPTNKNKTHNTEI
jgi:GTP-binding protein Era